MSRAGFRGHLQIIVVDSRRCREAPDSFEVKSGQQWRHWYRYQINWYRYPQAVRYSGVVVPVANQTDTSTQVLLEN